MASVRNLGLLLARVGVGVVFMAHGWQKFTTWGIDGTAAAFAQMGIPLPQVSAWFAALVELVGGAALVVGAAVPLFGGLLTLLMLAAVVLVHAGNGVFVAQNGFELVVALGAAALALAAVGAGRWSVDGLLAPKVAGVTSGTPADRETARA